MQVDYVRCKECGFVYDSTLNECPNCGAENIISEDYLSESIFNILD